MSRRYKNFRCEPPKGFDPSDWYWIVNNDETQVFSSALGDFVSSTNSVYQAWIADGTIPTRIDSHDSLGQVLAKHEIKPKHATVLDKYIDTQLNFLDKVQLKILFHTENRLRVLEGKQSITMGQYLAAIKSLIT